jgi:hypothetical protein
MRLCSSILTLLHVALEGSLMRAEEIAMGAELTGYAKSIPTGPQLGGSWTF